ncbi:MAG TPA: adenylyl-sulfate kinase [Bryobacteraceae bacterium]|nr:adenylyl-sulfate kinase [Bryobacteraceae bacterium]
MTTVERRTKSAFAIWVTGLPASGKSTLVASLKAELENRGADVAVLESDSLREILTPNPRYGEKERELFYRQMTYIGTLLVDHGVPVIFDATANRRCYRDEARAKISRFLEVYINCPLEVCMSRDPKGIYQKGREGKSGTVPGLQTAYEAPENPALVIHSDREAPQVAAQRVIAKLVEKGCLRDAPLTVHGERNRCDQQKDQE